VTNNQRESFKWIWVNGVYPKSQATGKISPNKVAVPYILPRAVKVVITVLMMIYVSNHSEYF